MVGNWAKEGLLVVIGQDVLSGFVNCLGDLFLVTLELYLFGNR